MSILDGQLERQIENKINPTITKEWLVSNGFQCVPQGDVLHYRRTCRRLTINYSYLDSTNLQNLPDLPDLRPPEIQESRATITLSQRLWPESLQWGFRTMRIDIHTPNEPDRQLHREWSHDIDVYEFLEEVDKYLKPMDIDICDYINTSTKYFAEVKFL